MSSETLPPNFDPFAQNFTLLLPDGSQFESTMADLDYYRQYGIRTSINYGTQIGASFILLLVLLLLTKREKRKSSIFIMNGLSLTANAIRSLLQCLYFTGEFWNPYALVSGDFSRVTNSDYANTIAANTMTTLTLIFVMVSLSLQVWVVCITAKPLQQYAILTITTSLALIAVGLRFAVTVISNTRALHNEGMSDYMTLLLMTTAFQTIAIWVYSCVFTFKLGYALIQRRRLKMAQFGPMQVIFIMGCQTMIIPAIFTTLQFYEKVPELGSQSLTMTCIFLPLSAIWAGIVSTDVRIGSRGPGSHQHLIQADFNRSALDTLNSCEKQTLASCTTNSTKDPDSPSHAIDPYRKGFADIDAIRVEHDWAVEHEASHKV